MPRFAATRLLVLGLSMAAAAVPILAADQTLVGAGNVAADQVAAHLRPATTGWRAFKAQRAQSG